ncbi:MAG: hypothetical protein HC886_11800 [Leptolyngbyaceae cyanobacterium SM1_1_3]|nr:hypothetical protein [Leptolyngbyaceae cyanobacterium SM1_1_3]
MSDESAQGSVERSPQFLATAKTALLKTTPVAERLPVISTGRSDPFISPFIPSRPLVTPVTSIKTAPAGIPAPSIATPASVPQSAQVPTSVTLQPLPPSLTRTPPILPPVPTELPTLSVPSLPISSPTVASASTSAAAIQISGVLQFANQISIVVEEPSAETSRYVRVGDYLANGQVRISRVEWPAGQDPVVILEQGGREYVKTVGGATVAQVR